MPHVSELGADQLGNMKLIIDLDTMAEWIREHCAGDFDNPEWFPDKAKPLEQRLAVQFMFVYKKWKQEGEPQDVGGEKNGEPNPNGEKGLAKPLIRMGTVKPPNKPMQRTGLRPAADRQGVRRRSARATVVSNRRPIRFSLCSLLVVLTWLGITLGVWRSLGPHGFGLGLYVCAGSWCAISFTRRPSFRPLNNQRWTIAETLMVFAVCAILHSLAMPAVMSKSHPRRFDPTTAVPVVNQPTTENAMQDGVEGVDNDESNGDQLSHPSDGWPGPKTPARRRATKE